MAITTVKPMMIVTDESCSHWSLELQSNAIPSLKWHISFDSPASASMHTWNTDKSKHTQLMLELEDCCHVLDLNV